MPLPKPQKGQKKQDFLDSCMANSVMNNEYPSEKQRYAICNSLWQKKEENNMDKENICELRTYPIELRISEENGKEKITGFGAVYNSRSVDLGGFTEIVMPGCFERSLKENKDIKSYFNHDPNKILGRTSAGTLKVKDDKNGVHYEADPPNTTYANDLKESMKRGDVKHSSFAFQVIKDKWEEKNGEHTRYLEDADIFELGPVTDPAYLGSNSKVRYRSAEKVYEEYLKKESLQRAEEEKEEEIRNSFVEAGIEYERLSDVLIRANRGEELTNSDCDLINANIKVLEKYSKAPLDGAEGGKGEENKAGRLNLMRKQLELIEKTL